ncbi:MAG: YfiR family protein [Desulfoplanes sp.]|nr:YfiR family protein [Desulfoplanes sp.]MDD4648491.1 YfiR family protein [Desulfoplanes sp.]
MSNRSSLFLFILALVLSVFIIPHEADALDTETAPEILKYRIKAAYIFNFAKFIEWPEQAFKDKNQPFSIVIMGDKKHLQCFESLESRTIHGRKIDITYCTSPEKLTTQSCYILFVTDQPLSRGCQSFLTNNSRPILTIGNSAHFIQAGGMIAFVQRDNKIRFAINQSKARQNNLCISSRLLRLAEKTYTSEKKP